MTDDDREYDATETDWVANCTHGYGVGYTKQQAILALFANVSITEEVEVLLVEHVGDADMSMMGVEVEHHVQSERVRISEEHARDLTVEASAATEQVEIALDMAVPIETQ